MKYYIHKIGIILSLLAISWIMIPCEGHCFIITKPVENNEHSCCTPNQNDTESPINEDNDGLQQICQSTYSGTVVPKVIKYDHHIASVNKLNVAIINTVQKTDNNFNINSFYASFDLSPPERIPTDYLVTHLYTSHAPPIL